MTNEQAIKMLKSKMDGHTDTSYEWAETVRMAIRALEQEPCEDCVSRQAVLDALDKSKYSKNFCEEHHIDWSINLGMAHIAVNELKSVIPQPTRWIPISERVPEYGEPVLTWDGNCYFVEKRIPCIRDENGEPIFSDWWVSDDYDESESEYYPNLRDGACIAWIPLPSQWKGTDLEDDD